MSAPKAVVVHRGARDGYQVAAALAEGGLLAALVTDLYWRGGGKRGSRVEALLPASLRRQLTQRTMPLLAGQTIDLCWASGLLSFAIGKAKRLPFSWLQSTTRATDAALGKRANVLATRHRAALLSYSYYGYDAFDGLKPELARILFQLHPHPASVRAILAQELERFPECRTSLEKEWELALPDEDFDRLVRETQMARHWMAASSFTKQTLVEQGIPAGDIRVIPYGVDATRFRPVAGKRVEEGRPLEILFVGTINQRKGIRYLLEALRLTGSKRIHLTVCGRVVDDLKIFVPFESQVTVHPNVSHAGLLAAYQQADLFVFPSVAEGFGHVVLEAMSSGLPVLSTTRTAAADLVAEAQEGFVIEPASAQAVAEKLEWALAHRRLLPQMGEAARRKAESLTWERFRSEVRSGYLAMTSVAGEREPVLASGRES